MSWRRSRGRGSNAIYRKETIIITTCKVRNGQVHGAGLLYVTTCTITCESEGRQQTKRKKKRKIKIKRVRVMRFTIFHARTQRFHSLGRLVHADWRSSTLYSLINWTLEHGRRYWRCSQLPAARTSAYHFLSFVFFSFQFP